MLSRQPRLRLRSRFMEIGRSSPELPSSSFSSIASQRDRKRRRPVNEPSLLPCTPFALIVSLIRAKKLHARALEAERLLPEENSRLPEFNRTTLSLSRCFFFGEEGCWPTPNNLETIVPKEGGRKVSFPVLKLYEDGAGVEESRVVWRVGEQVGLKSIAAWSVGLNLARSWPSRVRSKEISNGVRVVFVKINSRLIRLMDWERVVGG